MNPAADSILLVTRNYCASLWHFREFKRFLKKLANETCRAFWIIAGDAVADHLEVRFGLVGNVDDHSFARTMAWYFASRRTAPSAKGLIRPASASAIQRERA